MKTPFFKNYMPDVKLCRNQPFSGAIADTSRQEGRLTCPLWDPRKKTVSSPSFKCFLLSSSQKYLSFAFVLNLFRWSTHPRNPHYLYIVFAEVGAQTSQVMDCNMCRRSSNWSRRERAVIQCSPSVGCESKLIFSLIFKLKCDFGYSSYERRQTIAMALDTFISPFAHRIRYLDIDSVIRQSSWFHLTFPALEFLVVWDVSPDNAKSTLLFSPAPRLRRRLSRTTDVSTCRVASSEHADNLLSLSSIL